MTENNSITKEKKLKQKITFLIEAGEVVKGTATLEFEIKAKILKPIIAELNKALKLSDKLFNGKKDKHLVSEERYLEIVADANRFKEKYKRDD